MRPRIVAAAFLLIAGLLIAGFAGPATALDNGYPAVPLISADTTIIGEPLAYPTTGVCEIAGAAALFTTRLRWLASVMLALYALCVWPANIKHALEHIHLPPVPDSWWYHGPRLALQPVLIWWALFCAGVTDWPWRERSHKRTPHDR